MKIVELEMTPDRSERMTRASDRIIDVTMQEHLNPLEACVVLTTLLETLKEQWQIDSAHLVRMIARPQ